MIKVHEKLEHLGDFFKRTWQNFNTLLPLIWIRFQVECFNLKEYLFVVVKYYRHTSFMKADLLLLLHYVFHNPYRMNKNFLAKKGELEEVYGETPLTTLEKIVEKCEITSKDTVYELGSGRGRTCFWLGEVVGCKTVGIEYVPEFVSIAQKVKQKCGIEHVDFFQADFLSVDLSRATVIYLYGTCLTEEQIGLLINNLKKLPPGTKIITISYPLTNYTEEPLFELMSCFSGTFPWGTTDIYLQYRK